MTQAIQYNGKRCPACEMPLKAGCYSEFCGPECALAWATWYAKKKPNHVHNFRLHDMNPTAMPLSVAAKRPRGRQHTAKEPAQ